jgi:hypothetical protein
MYRSGDRFWILDCGFWIETAGASLPCNPKLKIRNPKWVHAIVLEGVIG